MTAIDPVPTRFEPGAPVEGGMIPLCVPEIRGNEWKYVKECLDTGWVSSAGPSVDRFEQEMARYLGAKYAIATTNGTAALHLAILVSGIQPNDEVLVSTLTFIAPVNAIRYARAWPIFIDAEPDYWQIDTEKAIHFLEKRCVCKNGNLYNKETDRRVSAILPVHILGHPVDIDPLIEIAERYNLKIIEDSSESLGAKYKGRMVGNLGDIACLSFNGNKIMTTGGGGMIITNDESMAIKAKYLATQAKDDPLEYVHKEIGYNYRLTNIQAALGIAQLEQIDKFIEKKRRIADNYGKSFEDIEHIVLMSEANWAHCTYWMYTILINYGTSNLPSRKVLRLLTDKRIQSRPLWQPIHISPAHKDLGYTQPSNPIAERLQNQGLSLPCSAGLSKNDQSIVIECIKGSLEKVIDNS